MSELDKYGKHDPLAQHSSYAKKSKITVADTDAWLKKHGNGMDRIKKPSNTKAVNVWADYSKVNTVELIYRHLKYMARLSLVTFRTCHAVARCMVNVKKWLKTVSWWHLKTIALLRMLIKSI